MGMFGGFFSKVGGAIKKAGKAVADKTKSAYNSVKTKVTNTWGKFTGKKTFEEAEQLYNEISSRYNRRRSAFDKEVERITDQIEGHVKAINGYKGRIKTELFAEMAGNLEKIRGIEFSKDFRLEEFKNAQLKLDKVRSKQSLYQIDFNKNKFKTNAQAIFTLGFYTRKKAKETLYAVEEEEYKVNAEIAKMDAELVKLKAIELSLKNVEYYFASMIDMYEQLLVRLENAVHHLYFQCMHFAHKLIRQEMKIKRLPLTQQKEIEAIMIASTILKTMAEMQIVSLEKESAAESYEQEMKSSHAEAVKVYEAA